MLSEGNGKIKQAHNVLAVLWKQPLIIGQLAPREPQTTIAPFQI
jgi:hypothetical protein